MNYKLRIYCYYHQQMQSHSEIIHLYSKAFYFGALYPIISKYKLKAIFERINKEGGRGKITHDLQLEKNTLY